MSAPATAATMPNAAIARVIVGLGVAFAAWIAVPQVGTDAGTVAAAPGAPSPVNPQIAAAPQRVPAGTGVPVAVGVEDYLLAHQRFSPVSRIQGVAPYVRTVSAERKGDGR